MFVRERQENIQLIFGRSGLCEADSESCEDLGQCCISSECRFQLMETSDEVKVHRWLASLGSAIANIHERASICSVYLHASAMLEVLCLISLVFTTALQSR